MVRSEGERHKQTHIDLFFYVGQRLLGGFKLGYLLPVSRLSPFPKRKVPPGFTARLK